MGKQVLELPETKLEEGTHSIAIDSSALPAGLYFTSLTTKQNMYTYKLEIVK
jgi:hypothetical protein